MSDVELRSLEAKTKADPNDMEARQAYLMARARKGEIQIAEINGVVWEVRPWVGSRTDVYGNNRACNCPDLKRVVGMFCVCYGLCWCPTHGGPHCVGGHD